MTPRWDKIKPLLEGGAEMTASEICEALGEGRMSIGIEMKQLCLLGLVTSRDSTSTKNKGTPVYRLQTEKVYTPPPGARVIRCEDFPINKAHDQCGTSSDRQRRPGGAIS